MAGCSHGALGLFLIELGLILVLLGALLRPRQNSRAAFDPHGEAYGDQPQVPL